MKELNALSLFDGMSCGQIALERAGIKVNNYFASEIDKYAEQLSSIIEEMQIKKPHQKTRKKYI